VNDAHAASTASHGGFDDDGITDFGGNFEGLGGRGDGIFRAGKCGDSGRGGEAARGGFVAEEFEKFRGRSNESDAGLGTSAGKRRIFSEEAVAGMDGVHIVGLGDAEDAGNVEIGFDGSFAGADAIGFVRFEAVKGEAVFLGIDGDGAEAEFVGGAENADGDFATVGGEEFANGTLFFHGNQSKRQMDACEILYFGMGAREERRKIWIARSGVSEKERVKITQRTLRSAEKSSMGLQGSGPAKAGRYLFTRGRA
jgi:hypothetical protein